MPTPDDGLNFIPFVVSVAYWAESAKYDSSAVTRLRRSDFMAAMYAFDFVLANFGIAIAARIPMITTTIRSSMRVKPFRMFFMWNALRMVEMDGAASRAVGRGGVNPSSQPGVWQRADQTAPPYSKLCLALTYDH